MQADEVSREYIERILKEHDPQHGWSFAPCPFCGSRDIGVKYKVLDRKIGHDSPCSAEEKVWAYCRYCGAAGSQKTGDLVYRDEVVALALEGWNKRSTDGKETEKTQPEN